MAYLVNPHGWRLYCSKYWNSNYYVEKRSSSVFMHQSKLISELLSSVLPRFNLSNLGPRSSFFKFASHKMFISNREVFIIIKYKLYWKSFMKNLLLDQNLFNTQSGLFKGLFERLTNKDELYGPKWRLNTRRLKTQPYNWLHKLSSSYLINTLTSKEIVFDDLYLNCIGIDTPNHKMIFKKLCFFLLLIPIFDFLKKYLSFSISSIFSKSPIVHVNFIGMGQNLFDPNHLLEYAEYLLRHKKYKPKKVFYIIIKILNRYYVKKNLRGFKLLLAGRFTRRDRAIYLWKTKEAVSLGTKTANIEYFTRLFVLKYSSCIAKIWICR